MEYRSHKGFDLSEIGIGCYALAGVYGKKDGEEFKRMLDRAYKMGVNFFDTAEGYGDAEGILGETVKPFREDVYIATKVGVKEGIEPNLSGEYIQRACEQSLERLGTDYIDLYQVHFDDPKTPVEETVHAFENLVNEGKIRHYGVGHLPVGKVETYCRKGHVFSVLMELSAVARRSRKELLPLCQKYKVGGIAFSTTGRGLLTGKFKGTPTFEPGDIRHMDPLFQRENFQSALRIVEKFEELGREYKKTPVQVAIAWVLSQPGIVCALTGPSTVAHLEENIGGSGWALSSEHGKELEELFKKEDEWLQKEQLSSIRSILSRELPQEFSKAFADLVYVLETSILLELVEEKEVLPVFYELFSMRKTPDTAQLESIQEKLKNILDVENLIL
ncbi:MAG: aldo/keto reductase [Theionarchaea archaeon]|nr:MAG: aldo/keto reductase [Theionarchaea archaeon DG-70-1]MBU7030693.1 aldo/keto reductase [Theionarchaea archaeon]